MEMSKRARWILINTLFMVVVVLGWRYGSVLAKAVVWIYIIISCALAAAVLFIGRNREPKKDAVVDSNGTKRSRKVSFLYDFLVAIVLSALGAPVTGFIYFSASETLRLASAKLLRTITVAKT